MATTKASDLVAGGSNSYLAAEFITRRVGEVAAQVANIFQRVWQESAEGKSTLTGHFRFRNPFAVASSQAEAVALPQVLWAPSGVNISAGLDGFSVIEGKQLDSLDPSILGMIAEDGGECLGRTVDTACASLFSSLTGGTVGSTGTAFTLTNALLADANLDAAFAKGPRSGYLNAHAMFNLRSDIMTKNFGVAKINVDAQGNETINSGAIVWQKNQLVPKINSNADYAGAVITEEAIGLVVAQQPQVEILPIPGSHAYAIDCTVSFGVGTVRPTMGVLVVSGVNA